jgi:VCBS repeat protein
MATTPILRTEATQVNTTDAAVGAGGNNTQNDGQIVALGDGGYVIVWTDGSRAFNPAGTAVLGQRYDAAGNRVGGEFDVSQLMAGDQSSPAVAPMPDGGFLVAFVDSANNGDIYVRRYDADLNLLRTDTIDNTAATTVQPAVTAFDDGSYVVAYTVGAANTDVAGRLVSPAGVVGSEFTIHADAEDSDSVELATLSNGNFVAVFRDDEDVIAIEGQIRYQVFQPDGTPVSASIRIQGGNETLQPDVAALRGGGFVFAYREDDDFSNNDELVIAVRGNDGRGVGVASLDIEGSNNVPRLVALSDGGFVVTWEPFFSDELRAQRFDAVLNPVGDRFVVRADVPFAPGPEVEGALLQDGRIAFAIADDTTGDRDVITSIWGATIDVAALDGVLWRHVDGTVVTRDIELATAAATWEIDGTGDFDADGDTDILWHHEDGLVVTWELQDGQFVQTHSLPSASTAWDIAATGDFDGDGDDDIVWRHEEGAVVTWEMEDGEFVQSHSIESASGLWSIRGTGDFDGDGDDDIVWHHRDGAVVTWEMQDGALADVHSIADAAGDWDIQGVHDFNGDGNADLLWRHAEGLVVTWDLDGGTLLQVNNHGVTPTTWQIQGTGQFDLA